LIPLIKPTARDNRQTSVSMQWDFENSAKRGMNYS